MKKDHSLKRKQLNYKKSRYNTKIVKLHFQKITLYYHGGKDDDC